MKISFAWWNTSLSPTRRQGRATDIEKAVAHRVLAELIVEKKVTLIGLCELSDEDVAELEVLTEKHGYSIVNGVNKVGRTTFDTCIIYKTKALNYKGSVDHSEVEDNRTRKIAQHALFNIVGKRQKVHVLLSHWPSVMLINANTAPRLMYGISLRRYIDQIWAGDNRALIVLMGDYNDEPFAEPIAYALKASRDIGSFGKSAQKLYNPFWKKMGSAIDYCHSRNEETHCGTYFHAENHQDRWRTFDQMIFSSGFLGLSMWHLDESSVGIIDIPEYTAHVLDKKSNFDHLPIMASVDWIGQ